MKHLESDHINGIVLQLSEDFYGANGELDEFQIRDRLMEAIIERCNHHIAGHSGMYGEDFIGMSVEEHAHKPAITLYQAAGLILGVWKDMDRDIMQMVAEWTPPALPLPETLEQAIAAKRSEAV
jgi:hypothetical protein